MINRQIEKALKALGVKGKITILKNDSFSTKVFLNGRYFGIYDLNKNTFVD